MNKKQKATLYTLADGDYYVVVREAFIVPNGKTRIVFEVLSKQSQIAIYLAGKNYSQDTPAFITELIAWLGDEQANKLVNDDGEIDLKALKGLKADITIVNIENDNHEEPFAHVSRIKPPGTLVDEVEEAA